MQPIFSHRFNVARQRAMSHDHGRRKKTNYRLLARRTLLPAATKLGQGNVFTGVCPSTGGKGVCLSACWDARPPRTGIPPDQAHSRTRHTPQSRQPPPSRPPGSRHHLPSRHPPPEQTPPPHPWSRLPHPRSRQPPGIRRPHMVNERLVRILLECILVTFLFRMKISPKT